MTINPTKSTFQMLPCDVVSSIGRFAPNIVTLCRAFRKLEPAILSGHNEAISRMLKLVLPNSETVPEEILKKLKMNIDESLTVGQSLFHLDLNRIGLKIAQLAQVVGL